MPNRFKSGPDAPPSAGGNEEVPTENTSVEGELSGTESVEGTEDRRARSTTGSSGEERSFDRIPIPTSLHEVLQLIRGDGLGGTLARGSMGSLSVKVGSVVLKFATGVLLARVLGPAEYGVYAYAFTVALILAIPTQLGLPNLLVRYVAQYQTRNQWGLLKGLLRRANQMVFLISLIVMGGIVGAIWLIYGSFGGGRAQTLLWASTLLPLLSLGELRSATLRGLRHVLLGLIPEKVVRWALLSLLVLGAYVLGSGSLSASGAMRMHAAAALIAFLLGAWWLYAKLPTPARQVEAVFDTSEWASVAVPFLLTGGMQILNNRLDILVVGWFWPDAEVGIYEIAVQVSMLLGLGLSASNMLVSPYLSRFHSQGNRTILQKIVSVAVGFSTVIALPPLLVLVGFGEEVLTWVFGGEYARGYWALIVLCLGQFSHVASGSVGILLNMTGHEWMTLKGVAGATLANLALNFLLIPVYGMEGAALATMVTFVLWNVVLVRWAYQELAVDPSLAGFFRSDVSNRT